MAGRPKNERLPHELTDQMIRFCHEYALDYNATQAAIRAGYSTKGAKQVGSRLLKHPGVREYFDRMEATRLGRLAVTADRIRNELAKIAFANMDDFVTVENNQVKLNNFSGMSRENKAAIAEVGQKSGKVTEKWLKFHSKTQSLELLGKTLGMFTDKTEHSGPGGGAIPIAVTVTYDDADPPNK